MDFRSIRLPIVISAYPSPGAASSYASNVFISAVRNGSYTLQVRETSNPALVYIEDCLKAIDLLTHAKRENMSRASYNLFSCAPSASEIVTEIMKQLPDVQIRFETDNKIADLIDSWPKTIEDQAAREDWGWSPDFMLEDMTKVCRPAGNECKRVKWREIGVFDRLELMAKVADYRGQSGTWP